MKEKIEILKLYKEMSAEEQLAYVTDLTSFAEEKLPLLCSLGQAWEKSRIKSMEEGLRLVSAFAYARDFVDKSLMFRDFSRRVERLRFYVELIRKEVSAGQALTTQQGDKLAIVPEVKAQRERRPRPRTYDKSTGQRLASTDTPLPASPQNAVLRLRGEWAPQPTETAYVWNAQYKDIVRHGDKFHTVANAGATLTFEVPGEGIDWAELPVVPVMESFGVVQSETQPEILQQANAQLALTEAAETPATAALPSSPVQGTLFGDEEEGETDTQYGKTDTKDRKTDTEEVKSNTQYVKSDTQGTKSELKNLPTEAETDVDVAALAGLRLHLDQLRWLLDPRTATRTERVAELRARAAMESNKAKQLAESLPEMVTLENGDIVARATLIAPHTQAAIAATAEYKDIYKCVDTCLASRYALFRAKPDALKDFHPERQRLNAEQVMAILKPYWQKMGSPEWKEAPIVFSSTARTGDQAGATQTPEEAQAQIDVVLRERRAKAHKYRTYFLRKDCRLTQSRIERMRLMIEEMKEWGNDVSEYALILRKKEEELKALEAESSEERFEEETSGEKADGESSGEKIEEGVSSENNPNPEEPIAE